MRKLLPILILLLAIAAAAAAEEPEFTGYPTIPVSETPMFTIEIPADQTAVYLPLDDLGRVQGAAAILGPYSVPLRSVITSIKPTGWQQASYPFIPGLSLYNRCHLLAHQLSGADSEENIFTGTQYINISAMAPIEDAIAAYIASGNRVRYEVRPYFIGEELVCRGVFINAVSIDAADLAVSVFCLNVQPGVAIDYRNGLSQIAPISARIESSEEPTRALPEESAEPTVSYVLNINTKRFHLPGCQSVIDMKEKNRRDFYGSRDELIEMGYKPCGSCNP